MLHFLLAPLYFLLNQLINFKFKIIMQNLIRFAHHWDVGTLEEFIVEMGGKVSNSKDIPFFFKKLNLILDRTLMG